MIAIAARTPSWLSALEKDYAARIVGFALHCRAIKPSSPTKEAAAVSAARPKRSRLFCLDADGVARDSAMFADFLQKGIAKRAFAGVCCRRRGRSSAAVARVRRRLGVAVPANFRPRHRPPVAGRAVVSRRLFDAKSSLSALTRASGKIKTGGACGRGRRARRKALRKD